MTRSLAPLCATVVVAFLVSTALAPIVGGVPAVSQPTDPGSSAHAHATANGTVDGTVTDPAGDPVANATVLVVRDRNLLAKQTVAELRELAANEASTDVASTRTGTDGRYSLSLEDGEHYAIALAPGDASAIAPVTVSPDATTSIDLVLHDHRPLEVRAHGGSAAAGETLTVSAKIYNNGAGPAENLTIAVRDVPAGWTVAGREDGGGAYDADAMRWRWESLPLQAFADPLMTFQVPEDAEPGTYTVTLVADSAHRDFDPVTVTVEVREPGTPGSPTVTPGGDGSGTETNGSTPMLPTVTSPTNGTTDPGSSSPTASPSSSPNGGGSGGSVPGFGPPAVVLATLVLTGQAARRRRSR